MKDIDRAARILRAGNEFSETNRKLREAVQWFVAWLFDCVKGHLYSPDEIGWAFEFKTDGVRLGFKCGDAWYSVYSNWAGQPMGDVVMFCRALAGEEGETLIRWFEQQTSERRQALEALVAMRQRLAGLAQTA